MEGMNYYWRNKDEFLNDDNIYVEFKTENDLLNAIHKNIQYKDFRIKGIKRGKMWPVTINIPPQIVERPKIKNINVNSMGNKSDKIVTQKVDCSTKKCL